MRKFIIYIVLTACLGALSQSIVAIDLLTIKDVSPELNKEGRKPLLLIHGWNMGPKPTPPGSGLWHPFKEYFLNDSVLKSNFKIYYVEYYSNEISVAELAAELRKEIEAEGMHQEAIAIVAHSMGGLVARSYMQEQTFSKGRHKGDLCGSWVDLLVTLGTPHHGSPMANGPARNNRVGFPVNLYLSLIELIAFADVPYNELNRSNLWWDNYDKLFNYNIFPNERNEWLENLNSDTSMDFKYICYNSSITGSPTIPSEGNVDEEYRFAAWFIEQGLSMPNDGIVPFVSSEFAQHEVRRTRFFNEYNHSDIITGKEDKNKLFDPLAEDLLEAVPLKLLEPFASEVAFLEHSQKQMIKWQAPFTIERINIYFSTDKGQRFEKIADNIQAENREFEWLVPDINSSECMLLIEDVKSGRLAFSSKPFTVYHNQFALTLPDGKAYFLNYQADTLYWQKNGLGDFMEIVYTDTSNNISVTLVDSLWMNDSTSFFVWPADSTLPPTAGAYLDFNVFGMPEDMGNAETYTYRSTSIDLFGPPSAKLLSPMTLAVDSLGKSGYPLLANANYDIHFEISGAIKYAALYLCNSQKEIVQSIDTVYMQPGFDLDKSLQWQVPDLAMDSLFFLLRAGLNESNISNEVYSSGMVNVNYLPGIKAPAANSENESLYPCFRVSVPDDTNNVTYVVSDEKGRVVGEIHGIDSAACWPMDRALELEPGEQYSLKVWAASDTWQSFTNEVDFRTGEFAPDSLTILSEKVDTVLTDSVTIVWNYSAGSDYYGLEAFQNSGWSQVIDSIDVGDTLKIIDISEATLNERIFISVAAYNEFGSSLDSTSFLKTAIDNSTFNRKESAIKVYPNPVIDRMKVEIPTGESLLAYSVYLNTGVRILYEKVFGAGDRANFILINLPKGIKRGSYVLKLNTGKGIYSTPFSVQ